MGAVLSKHMHLHQEPHSTRSTRKNQLFAKTHTQKKRRFKDVLDIERVNERNV